jgi:hypothetical protein
VPYNDLPKPVDNQNLSKLAVLKVNGGLGTSMGQLLHYLPFQLIFQLYFRDDGSQERSGGQG